MKVVSHDAEGHQPHPVSVHRFAENTQKRGVIARFVEHDLAPVGPVHHVVNQPRRPVSM